MSYMNQNKKHKQSLESAQYGLEISFKLDWRTQSNSIKRLSSITERFTDTPGIVFNSGYSVEYE